MNRKFQCLLVIVMLLLMSAGSAIAGGAGPKIYNYTLDNESDYMIDLYRANKENYQTRIFAAYPNDRANCQDTREPARLYLYVRNSIQSKAKKLICNKSWPNKKRSVDIVVSKDLNCRFEFSD